MKRLMPFYWPASPVCTPSGEVSPFLGTIRRNKLLIVVALALMSLGSAKPSYGQTVFNCPSGFAATGPCEVVAGGPSGGENFAMSGGASNILVGTQAQLLQNGTTHNVGYMNWQQAVNVQAFTATFTFVPNGQNVSFVLNNNTNCPQGGGCGPLFSSGAGCEAGIYQGFSSSTPPWPNNVWAMEFDSYSYISNGGPFTYSSVQTYTTSQNPCNPDDGDSNWTYIPKISTSPVPLDDPATSQGTSTGDTYSATITYDGTNVTLNMYDVTAGGSCPGASCFTHTWNNVNIPELVGGNTAYVGTTAATGLTSVYPLYIGSFSYAVGTPGNKPSPPTGLSGSEVAHGA